MNKVRLLNKIDVIDNRIAGFMERYGRLFLRYSLGIIFIWFGILKPLGLSPAAALVERTVYWFPPEVFIPILGWWEVLIGQILYCHLLLCQLRHQILKL